MPNRWTILAVLFFARFAMAMQFQSAAALAPHLRAGYGIGLAEIGILIGLYLAPGIVVAIPGGALAARFGDKRVVGLSLAAMLAGGAVASFATAWDGVLAGRILAGIGGVFVNIVMTKMVVDWFAERGLATALAIFITSWPVGIAVALIVLPPLAAAGGMAWANAALLAALGLALALFVRLYRPAPAAEVGQTAGQTGGSQTGDQTEGQTARESRGHSAGPGAGPVAGPVAGSRVGFPVAALLLAGLIWAVYNAALAMVFSFGAPAFAARGWNAGAASGLIGAVMVAFSLAVPAGGYLADRTGRRDTIIALGLAAYTIALPALFVVPAWGAVPLLIAAGLLYGCAAGPIMALPAAVLPPAARALGMGVFFTLWYIVMMGAPSLAGRLADRAGDPSLVFWLGAAMSAACLIGLALFRRGTVGLRNRAVP